MMRLRQIAVLMAVVLAIGVSFGYGYCSNRKERPRLASIAGPAHVYNRDGSVAPSLLPSKSETLIFFVVSTDCAFCKDATPLWRDISERVRESKTVQVSILSFSTPDQTDAFLAAHNLSDLALYYMNEDTVRDLRAWSVPATGLLSSGGELLYWDGVPAADDIDAIVASAMQLGR